jgi:hypothetical protein
LAIKALEQAKPRPATRSMATFCAVSCLSATASSARRSRHARNRAIYERIFTAIDSFGKVLTKGLKLPP